MLPLLERYFDFLLKCGFKGPFSYSYIRELHTNYVKGNIIIDIVYDGGYWVNIYKTKKAILELELGTKRIVDLEFPEMKLYDLAGLDAKKQIYKSGYFNNNLEKQLCYYSKLLLDNPEILYGNLAKFNLINSLFRKLGLSKKH